MSKTKAFAKNQILEKSLDGYRPTFRYGERLKMYNNVYKVVGYQDKGYTFLEDEKNSKLAFPTNKLRMLMKKDLCLSLGMVNLEQDLTEASYVSKAQPAPTTKMESSKPAGQPKGEPVGTVKLGKDGDTYKKTSANPSVWVRVSTGTVHHDAGGDEQDPMSVSHESRQQFQRMMSAIDSKVHPDDREKIHSKAQEWIKENSKFKHMQVAHNTNEVDNQGKKLPKAGIDSNTMNSVYAQGDKARKLRQDLIDMVKVSHTKLRGGSGAK